MVSGSASLAGLKCPPTARFQMSKEADRSHMAMSYARAMISAMVAHVGLNEPFLSLHPIPSTIDSTSNS
jgi:hypothetical protein